MRWHSIRRKRRGQLRFEIEAAFSQGLPNTPMANAIVRVVSATSSRAAGRHRRRRRLHHSGVVRKVDGAAIRSAIDIGAMVLLSPFGFSPPARPSTSRWKTCHKYRHRAAGDKLLFITECPAFTRPGDPESAIDTELALADAERLLAQLPRPEKPTDPAFYLQHCVRACRGGSSARTSCRSRWMARC